METRTVNPSWRKSSYSSGNGGQCVEAGHVVGEVLVRDTTDRDGVTLSVSLAAWASFTASLK
jgi:Domain of unknown function (DUF397)